MIWYFLKFVYEWRITKFYQSPQLKYSANLLYQNANEIFHKCHNSRIYLLETCLFCFRTSRTLMENNRLANAYTMLPCVICSKQAIKAMKNLKKQGFCSIIFMFISFLRSWKYSDRIPIETHCKRISLHVGWKMVKTVLDC